MLYTATIVKVHAIHDTVSHFSLQDVVLAPPVGKDL